MMSFPQNDSKNIKIQNIETNKNSSIISQKFTDSLNQNLNKNTPILEKKWSEKEIIKLKNLIKLYNYKDFVTISKNIPGTTPEQCSSKWKKILQLEATKGHWSPQEDNLLIDWVKKNGPKKWTLCSRIIPGRNGKQCREHWNNSLDPNLKKGKWSIEEDYLIYYFYSKYDGSWKKIAPLFEGRTENAIKNRFFSQLRKTASIYSNPNNFLDKKNTMIKNKIIREKKYSISKNKLSNLLKFFDIVIENAKKAICIKKQMNEEQLNEYIKMNEDKLNNILSKKNNIEKNDKMKEKEINNNNFLQKKTKRSKKFNKSKRKKIKKNALIDFKINNITNIIGTSNKINLNYDNSSIIKNENEKENIINIFEKCKLYENEEKNDNTQENNEKFENDKINFDFQDYSLNMQKTDSFDLTNKNKFYIKNSKVSLNLNSLFNYNPAINIYQIRPSNDFKNKLLIPRNVSCKYCKFDLQLLSNHGLGIIEKILNEIKMQYFQVLNLIIVLDKLSIIVKILENYL